MTYQRYNKNVRWKCRLTLKNLRKIEGWDYSRYESQFEKGQKVLKVEMEEEREKQSMQNKFIGELMTQ